MMKKILRSVVFIALAAIVFSPTKTLAAYNLTVVPSPTNLSATLIASKDSTSTFELFVRESPFPSETYSIAVKNNETGPAKKVSTVNGTALWQVSALPNTTYYLRVVERSYSLDKKKSTPFYTSNTVTVTTPSISITPSILDVEFSDTGSAFIVGKIDTVKNPDFKRYTITLQYSKDPLKSFTATVPGPLKIFQSDSNDNKNEGVDDKGVYHLLITGLTPGVKYNLRETVSFGKNTPTTQDLTFSSAGYQVATVENTNADFEARSYRLLAPFPGMSVLLDPDLCQEQKNQGKEVFGGECGNQVNAFLNLVFKILIGAAAVLLVLRIMFEGYTYIVSDIPALKTSAKNGLQNALLGLLVALSSYLILNTINPKIVENTINTDQLQIGVTGIDGLGLLGTGAASSTNDVQWAKTNGRKTSLTLKNNTVVPVIACDENQMQSIIAFGKIFEVHKNLVASIKRIDVKWQTMNPRYEIKTIGGYNCRTIAKSNKLSYHAYGLALDINENTNGVNTAGNMPASFKKLWTDEGWGWGGGWSSYKDPMHFSKGNNEQGDLRGE